MAVELCIMGKILNEKRKRDRERERERERDRERHRQREIESKRERVGMNARNKYTVASTWKT